MPVNLSKVREAWGEVTAQADQAVSLLLAGNPRLVELVQAQFSMGGTVPATWVGPLGRLEELGSQPGEVVLVLVNAEEEEQARAALTKRVPRAGVVLGVATEGGLGAAVYLQRRCLRVPFADTPAGWKRLFAACAEVAGDAVVALGRRYPAIRAAAAQRVVLRTAWQNALVGLAFLLPGADMPAMTLNQMKMLLLLAAMHEQEVNAERAVELAMVLGLGYGFRGLARRLVRSRRGYGWLIKGAVGYGATLLLGLGAVRYFTAGAPASLSKVIALARRLKR